MQVPLQIVMRTEAASDAVEARIRDNAARLERFHPRITSCRVVVEEAAKHQRTGRQFEVHIDVRVPGHNDIVATRHADADVNIAVREAFAAVTRQLEAAAGEMRGGTTRSATPK